MKAALLGLTHPHSGVLLTTLENLPWITAVNLWDSDPAVLARPPFPPSAKVSTAPPDLDALLAQPDLRFALVCVPTNQAASLAHRVIAARKHLVAEKPVGLTSDEIRGVQAAAARAGVVASVLYPRRLHPCALAARELVRAGALGSLLSVEARFLTTQVRFRHPESWLFRRSEAGGGILSWLGCHCLDLIHFITNDEVSSVGAALARRSGEAIDVEDTAALTLKFRSGAIGTFLSGYSLAYDGAGYLNRSGYDSYLGLNGRSGRIVWPDLNPRLFIESAPAPGQSPAREQSYPFPASTSYSGATGDDFFCRFLAAIRGEGPPPTTLADALRTALILEAAERSSATGQFIPVAS